MARAADTDSSSATANPPHLRQGPFTDIAGEQSKPRAAAPRAGDARATRRKREHFLALGDLTRAAP